MELNDFLLKELIYCKNNDVITYDLCELYLEVIKFEFSTPKYLTFTDEMREDLTGIAFDYCYKYGLNFNPDKSDDALAYMIIIIRSCLYNIGLNKYKNQDFK